MSGSGGRSRSVLDGPPQRGVNMAKAFPTSGGPCRCRLSDRRTRYALVCGLGVALLLVRTVVAWVALQAGLEEATVRAFLAERSMQHHPALSAEEMRASGANISILAWERVDSHFGDWTRMDLGCGFGCHYTYDRSTIDSADAILFHGPTSDANTIPDLPKSPFQPWILLTSETADYFPVMKRSDWWLRGDIVPIGYNALPPLGDKVEAYVRGAPPAVPVAGHAPAAFFANNCEWSPGAKRRADYVRALMRHMKVDSYGSCLHTKDYPVDVGARPQDYNLKVQVSTGYKFVLAFENENATDWVTEKVWHAFHAGVVPVYMGAPNIDAHLPAAHSIINIADFESPAALAAYLTFLDSHPAEYRKYLAWRDPSHPLRPGFVDFFRVTQEPVSCRLCRAVAGVQRETTARLASLRQAGQSVPAPRSMPEGSERGLLEHSRLRQSD